jgi:hypothetical protein
VMSAAEFTPPSAPVESFKPAAPVAEAPAQVAAPAAPAAPTAPASSFTEVDQIGSTVAQRSAPRERRRSTAATSEPLVFIETDAGKAQATPAQQTLAEFEPQRRNAPRPRRERRANNEQLEFVETSNAPAATNDTPPSA